MAAGAASGAAGAAAAAAAAAFVQRLVDDNVDEREPSDLAAVVEGRAPSAARLGSVFASDVASRPLLLDNPTPAPSMAKLERREANERADRSRDRFLSARQRRRLRLSQPPPEGSVSFETFAELHALWRQYMADLLGPEPSLSAAELKLAKADLHGALLTVERGRCPQLVGVSGIVVQETTNTFVVVTRAGRVRRLPKQHHVFVLQLGDALSVRVFGNHLRFRTTERSARKLKAKTTVEL